MCDRQFINLIFISLIRNINALNIQNLVTVKMPIEGDYYDNIPEDSRNESFDLEQYEREGGKDGGIKQDDISAMRREIGNLELSLEKARRTETLKLGILSFCACLSLVF